jgi:hypothetical protein
MIITDPGISEGTAALMSGKYRFGLAVRRAIYKRDDRTDGTTVNNDDQTKINLFGLDPEKTTVFFLDEIQLGVDYKVSEKTTGRVSVGKDTVEFNFDPGTTLPGSNENSERYGYYKISGTLSMKTARFVLNVGANFNRRDHEFTRGNDNKVHYTSDGRDFYAQVGTSI